MGNLLIVLTVAAVSALTFVAYRNPRLYHIAIAGTLILWMAMIGIAVWSAALIAARAEVIERVAPEELEAALDGLDAVSIGFVPGALIAAAAFLMAGMVFLPLILGKEDNGGRRVAKPKEPVGTSIEESDEAGAEADRGGTGTGV